jgi:hypothetical protein
MKQCNFKYNGKQILSRYFLFLLRRKKSELAPFSFKLTQFKYYDNKILSRCDRLRHVHKKPRPTFIFFKNQRILNKMTKRYYPDMSAFVMITKVLINRDRRLFSLKLMQLETHKQSDIIPM